MISKIDQIEETIKDGMENVNAFYDGMLQYPGEKRRFERDIAPYMEALANITILKENIDVKDLRKSIVKFKTFQVNDDVCQFKMSRPIIPKDIHESRILDALENFMDFMEER